jgi:lipoprotein-releasing system permease protein
MYKLLLCLRYLRTRYIALASIISVTLGVATMIVVNAVMAGFTHEMQDRMHNILSDLVFESHSLTGFENPDWHMEQIQQVAGQWIDGMTPTVHVPALLSYPRSIGWQQRQITLIGIDEQTYSKVSNCGDYLQHPENRKQVSFALRDGGYDVRDHQAGPNAPLRPDMEKAGKQWRKFMAERMKAQEELQGQGSGFGAQEPEIRSQESGVIDPSLAPVPRPDASEASDSNTTTQNTAPLPSRNPFEQYQPPAKIFDPAIDIHPGIILGIALASGRDHQGNDHFWMLPGDDVVVTVPTDGQPPKGASQSFTVVDFYESKMSEYDSSFVFVSMQQLQQMRGMGPKATSIQIKLKPGADGNQVRDTLRAAFPVDLFGIYTWRDKQGALLAAVEMEKAVLNILLFLIIAVAGFGILAIFFMIVVEKTRDIGILKSLGASSRGIMGIFLGYGLSLGIVGSGVGMVLGLLFVKYINQIRVGLEWISGQAVFDPAIYYFYEIPTIVDTFTVTWIVLGALLIAVLASILPAFRAARLHPVEALRYE